MLKPNVKNAMLIAISFIIGHSVISIDYANFEIIGLIKIAAFIVIFYMIKKHMLIEDEEQEKEMKTLYEKLERDRKTSAFTRKAMHNWFMVKKHYLNETGKPLSAVIIDLNNYNEIKKEKGTKAINLILKEMVELMNDSTRRMIDFVAKIDEGRFIILCFEKEENALIIGERIENNIKNKDWLNDEKLLCTIAVSEINLQESFESEIQKSEQVLTNNKNRRASTIFIRSQLEMA